MLSYRHGYHAGNHADVLKHIGLVALLRALQKKAKPLCVLDTHGGAGAYRLDQGSAAAQGEWREGIARVRAAEAPPPLVADYLSLCGEHPYYPGSPQLSARLARPGDVVQVCERHPAEQQALQALFQRTRQVHVHARDGYTAIRALLPPVQRRGLTLIDPSYERDDDYRAVVRACQELHQRFRAGVVAVWYPRIPGRSSQRMLGGLARLGIDDSFVAELDVRAPGPGLHGSGLAVLNAPYQVDTALREVLPWLATTLAQDQGDWRLEALGNRA